MRKMLFPTLIIVIAIIIIIALLLSGSVTQNNQTNLDSLANNTSAENNPLISNSWYQPKPGASWQIQLAGDINTSYNVDLYDLDLVTTPQSTIDELHNRGIKVVCYFSAGSWENYRPDVSDFPKDIIGHTLTDWPDENWLDISHSEKFADIMKRRLDLAVQKNCDGVDADNLDSWQNDTGFNLTYADQLNYNRWLANEAHQRNLAIGLKNDLGQINDLVNNFDFAINEQCFYYQECSLLLPFINQNKAVLGIEYQLEPQNFCDEANRLNFSWLKMNNNLDGSRISCR